MRGRGVRVLLVLVLVGMLGAGAALAASASTRSSVGTVRVAKSSKFGMVLVGGSGRTVYRYMVDSKGVNRCSSNATCNKFWPALLIKAGLKPSAGSGAASSLLGTIKAAHGMAQVTYAGFPLYSFSGDKAAGQTSGEGFEGKWFVVDAKGAPVKHAVKAVAAGGTTTTKKSAWG